MISMDTTELNLKSSGAVTENERGFGEDLWQVSQRFLMSSMRFRVAGVALFGCARLKRENSLLADGWKKWRWSLLSSVLLNKVWDRFQVR